VVDQVLARETSSGVAWYLPDRLGTVRDLVDNSGTIIDHVDYGAYGDVLGESAPASASGDRLVGFAGLERDTATNLNLAVERVQQPIIGRWTSPDPTGFSAGDTNIYRYINNSPTSATDPLGLDWLDWVTGWIPDPFGAADAGTMAGNLVCLGSNVNNDDDNNKKNDPFNLDKYNGNGPLPDRFPGGHPISGGTASGLEGAAILGSAATSPFKPGFSPPPGTRRIPKGIPGSWRIRPSKGNGGVLYYDPRNKGNSVRVMPGNPHSPYPNSRAPYVRWQKNGQPLDACGKVLPTSKTPDAHIPLPEFKFNPELFFK
jgi:RHS repeat-associated protein